MKLSDLFKSSIRSINRNRTRALLTMLGIIMGVGAVIGLMAIGAGSETSIKGELGKLGSNTIMIIPATQSRGGVNTGMGNLDALKERDVDEIIKYSPSVKYISPIISTNVQAVNGPKNSRPTITGAYNDYFYIQTLEAELGQLYDDKTGKSLDKVCVIGKTVANELFDNNANPVGEIIRLNKIPFRIIGVLAEKGQNNFGIDRDNVIIAPFKSVQKRLMGVTYAASFSASAINEENVYEAVDQINKVMINRLHKTSSNEPVFEIRTMKEMMDIMGSVTGMLTILLTAVASISLVVGGIGIMNIMLVSVKERTREIGLRLAVGAPSNAILLQFLLEAVLLSLIGGVIGIMLGFLIAKIGGILLGWEITVSLGSISMAFGFSFFVGVVFGFFPAREAAGLHPIEALRYE